MIPFTISAVLHVRYNLWGSRQLWEAEACWWALKSGETAVRSLDMLTSLEIRRNICHVRLFSDGSALVTYTDLLLNRDLCNETISRGCDCKFEFELKSENCDDTVTSPGWSEHLAKCLWNSPRLLDRHITKPTLSIVKDKDAHTQESTFYHAITHHGGQL